MKHILPYSSFLTEAAFNTSLEDWCREKGYDLDDDTMFMQYSDEYIRARFFAPKSKKIPNLQTVTPKYIADYIHQEGIQDETTTRDEKDLIKTCVGDLMKLKNTPGDNVTLYRLIMVNSEEEIKHDDIGIHFVANTWVFNDGGFLDEIGYGDDFDEDALSFMLTCEVPKSDVDINATLNHNLKYCRETEITLKSPNRARIIAIEPH